MKNEKQDIILKIRLDYILLLILISILLIYFVIDTHNNNNVTINKEASKIWCEQYDGKENVVFNSTTTCDCLTRHHAVKVITENNWVYPLGECLNFKHFTDKNLGLLFIVNTDTQYNGYRDAIDLITKFKMPITIWMVDVRNIQEKEMKIEPEID